MDLSVPFFGSEPSTAMYGHVSRCGFRPIQGVISTGRGISTGSFCPGRLLKPRPWTCIGAFSKILASPHMPSQLYSGNMYDNLIKEIGLE